MINHKCSERDCSYDILHNADNFYITIQHSVFQNVEHTLELGQDEMPIGLLLVASPPKT